jgi:Uncharacterized conserved protein
VPRRAKVALVLLIPYLAMPFDLVPDFIPVAGQLDDAILVALVLAYVVRRAGRGVVEELWPGSEAAYESCSRSSPNSRQPRHVPNRTGLTPAFRDTSRLRGPVAPGPGPG